MPQTPDNSNVPQKLNLHSQDVAAQRRQQLREIMPEVFKDGGLIDFEALRRSLGDGLEPARERFGLTWAGKSEAMRAIQSTSVATLRPVRDESVNFDSTENMIIEGDNLEVLKLLQKSYYNKIKMIYIDPPYNTGEDFIYHDNFKEGLEEYLRYTGQTDADGKKNQANTEREGRLHSNWLNMIYPRLYLARNLLRDDGVIFISIDDNEVANLKLVMNEIFGEENNISELIWNLGTGTQAGHFTRSHEYILCYAKNRDDLTWFKDSSGGIIAHGALKKISTANPASEVLFRKGSISFQGKDAEFSGVLGGSEKQFILSEKMIFKDGILAEDVIIKAGWAMKNQLISWLKGEETYDTKGQKVNKFYFNNKGILFYEKERGTSHPKTVLESKNVGSTKNGTDELIALMDEKLFDYPKPVQLIRFFIELVSPTENDDIILDFFAGSGTTAHAVLDLNKQDEGNRQFILVQLPEHTPPESPARKAGYLKISEITRERVRRVIHKLDQEDKTLGKPDQGLLLDSSKLEAKAPAQLQDRGFRSYHLTTSNFKVWDGETLAAKMQEAKEQEEKTGQPDVAAKALEEQLQLFSDHVLQGRNKEDMLAELLLKIGYPLTSQLQRLQLGGNEVFAIDDCMVLFCLDESISLACIEEMAALCPSQIICLDKGFQGSDQLKVNAVQTVKAYNRNNDADIQFKTV